MDLGWLLTVPRRRWKLIIAVPLLCLFAAQGIFKLLTPVYQSSVSILMFEPQQREISAIGQQEHSAWDFDTLAMNTEIEIIRSDSMLLRVVKDLKLDENPEFQQQNRFGWFHERLVQPLSAWIGSRMRGVFGPTGSDGTDAANDHMQPEDAATIADERTAQAVGTLRDHVIVQRATLAYILIVSARSRSPRLAQQLATQLVDDYFADQQKARQKAMDQLALWLSAKIAELKGRAIETETAIEKLKAANGFSDKGMDSAVERQITDLNAQLTATRADEADKRARLEQARQLSAGAGRDVPDAVASPMISQLRLQQSVLTQQQAQLREKFGAGHASVSAIATQLAGINQAINDEATRIRAELQSGYDIDVRREQSLEADLQRLAAARGNSDDHVKLQELQRTADADNRIYDAYLSRYNQIEASKSLVDSSERVISPAGIPSQPVFPPRRSVILMGGGGLGMVLGIMVAVALDYFQLGMKMGADAEQAFGYPVIGNVPLFRQDRRGRQADGRTLVHAVVSAPLSPFSEAVRTIRLALRLANPEDNPKVIVVTSSLPGEGKSTIATLLAASSAAAGHRTVLVDCDVRGRGISRDFEKTQPGLTDLLSGNADLGAVTLSPPHIGCSVIPAGSIMRSPGDLLASPGMSELVTRLRRDYDYVVIDTPPLLSVVDALALASMADKILVTIDGRSTRQVSVAEAFRLLRPETQRIAGIVFNKVDPDQMRRYGMYPDSRYYT